MKPILAIKISTSFDDQEKLTEFLSKEEELKNDYHIIVLNGDITATVLNDEKLITIIEDIWNAGYESDISISNEEWIKKIITCIHNQEKKK